MNNKQLRLVLFGALAAVILAFMLIGAFGLSVLSAKSQKMVDLKSQSKILDSQLNNLEQSKKEVQQYSYFRDVAKSVIPSDKNQAQAVLDIINLANESGIELQSITFPTSTLGGTTSDSATPTNAQTAATSKVITQAKPVPGIQGLYSIELTITPASGPNVAAGKQVTYAKMLDFLDRVERNRRTAQVSQVTVQTQSGDTAGSQTINFILVVNIFIKP